jgi:hypothetical protein
MAGSAGFIPYAASATSIENSTIKFSTDATSLRPLTNLFNIPGINSGTTPFQFFHHGKLAATSAVTEAARLAMPKGLAIINWSVNLVNNWVWDEGDQRAEPFDVTMPMIGFELGGEGVLCHYTAPGSIPATAFHEITRFGGGVEGLSGVDPLTTSIPFNQFKTTIFAAWQSSTTPSAATSESWWGGTNNAIGGRRNPMLWLQCEEQIGADGTFDVNEYARLEMNATDSGAYPSVYFFKSQGTFQAKTAQAINSITGKIGSNTYDGSTYQNTANIVFVSGGTVSSGNAGQSIAFQTSNTNTAGIANRMRISQVGSFDMWDGAAWQAGTAGHFLRSSATGVPTWSNIFGATGATIGFYGVTAVARQLLPTGSTTDQLITALQTLGLIRQS